MRDEWLNRANERAETSSEKERIASLKRSLEAEIGGERDMLLYMKTKYGIRDYTELTLQLSGLAVVLGVVAILARTTETNYGLLCVLLLLALAAVAAYVWRYVRELKNCREIAMILEAIEKEMDRA
jgi:hypothetical protein